MLPLLISHLSIVSSIGAGRIGDLVGPALRHAAVCGPARFETVALPTYVGEVEGTGRRANCRRRLPHSTAATTVSRRWRFARTDSEDAVAAPRRIAMARGGSACSWAPAPPASCKRNWPIGRAMRRPGHCRPDVRLCARRRIPARSPRYLRQRLGVDGPIVRCLLRLRIDRQGVRHRRAHDRGRALRCRHRRRSGLAVPYDAVRLPRAGTERAGPVPSVR